jgi:hypothetical protein
MQNRQSPAEKGEARRDEILFVDQLNDSLALARVQLEMMGGVMQDYLSLLKIDGKEVVTPADVKSIHSEALSNVAEKHRVIVVLLRNGEQRQLVLDFSRQYDKE